MSLARARAGCPFGKLRAGSRDSRRDAGATFKRALLVAQGFNRIKSCRLDRREHAADNAYEAENRRRPDQRGRIDVEVDIAFAGVVLEGAPQSERAYTPGNQIGQHYSQQAAQSRDHEGFGEELEQDVPAMCAQRLFHANLAGALGYRNQHDVHQADAADAEGQQSDEAKQDFDSSADDLKIEQVGEDVEDKNCPVVLGIKTVMEGHRVAYRRYDLCMISLVLHHNGIQVIGLGQVAHGAERNVDMAVNVIVAVIMHLMAEHSDDLIRNAVKADAFAESGLPGQKVRSHVRADDGDAGVSKVIRFAEETALLGVQAAHASVGSINTADAVAGAAGTVGHKTLLGDLGRNVFEQGHFVADVIEILNCQLDFGASLGSSRL